MHGAHADHQRRHAAAARSMPPPRGRRWGRGVRLCQAYLAYLTLAGLCLGALPSRAAEPADPLASPSWPEVRRKIAGSAPVHFDPRVQVLAPEKAEDSLNVPVTVQIRELPDIRRVVVVADLNPILKVLEFEPLKAVPRLSFRFKLQQGSPVRALVLAGDGAWYAGGVWIDATGGGCTAPSVGRSTGTWAETLNQVDSRRWPRSEGQRIKFRIMHPMDTGLAPGIPAFYLERLALRDAGGEDWVRLNTFEPVSENPMFSLEFDRPTPLLTLVGADNNGNRVNARVQP